MSEPPTIKVKIGHDAFSSEVLLGNEKLMFVQRITMDLDARAEDSEQVKIAIHFLNPFEFCGEIDKFQFEKEEITTLKKFLAAYEAAHP